MAEAGPALTARPDHVPADRVVDFDYVHPQGLEALGVYRAEIQIFLEEFVGRMPPFRLDPDKANPEHCGSVPGFDELHLRWD